MQIPETKYNKCKICYQKYETCFLYTKYFKFLRDQNVPKLFSQIHHELQNCLFQMELIKYLLLHSLIFLEI